ncbi:hypothetical protein FBY35_5901 [Streptomyces sp. SLBN-118]|uniref:hypothetical protein n=1 Tax=Streptomyces sp. SLBN-118 TaxID=2768454 RepID=UPI00115311BA|nr:hypothetical protein [Streptomyces sp. SLBN-118]TQK44397.1 hypothetical protein FBY35_5901 [Streptomyces sp. SLBN-118]
MTAPNQDPTPWELMRAMQQLRDDLRADLAALGTRLEQMVTKDVYAADQRAAAQRMASLEDDLRDVQQQRESEKLEARTNRRLAVSALVAPIVVAVTVAVVLAALGLS